MAGTNSKKQNIVIPLIINGYHIEFIYQKAMSTYGPLYSRYLYYWVKVNGRHAKSRPGKSNTKRGIRIRLSGHKVGERWKNFNYDINIIKRNQTNGDLEDLRNSTHDKVLCLLGIKVGELTMKTHTSNIKRTNCEDHELAKQILDFIEKELPIWLRI